MKNFNVLDYGVDISGTKRCSEIVQKLVDDCFVCGGGNIIFPKGKYVLSTIFLKSNVHICLEDGAEILGAESFYDYAPEEKIEYVAYQDSSHTYYHCSLFVGIECENISITGNGSIDMRAVWDEDDVRGIIHRGPKCIALKYCKNVEISGFKIENATDLAVYFSGCENVDIHHLKLRVFIDGISPDNSKNVCIHDCEVEAGDDAIVFKSSYTLNKIDICKNIHVYNCKLKSRCHALKFGTETNGGFEDFIIEDLEIFDTRICGLSIESVDGAIVDNVQIRNVRMTNVQVPLFIHVGRRMRGPVGRAVGQIKNVKIENVVATGPYEPYEIVAWNYDSYKEKDFYQYPWKFGYAAGLFTDELDPEKDAWQMTANICGLKESPLQNISLRNIYMELDGGVTEYSREVPEDAQDYPEVYAYGRILPAKGIYFRHINGLKMDNVIVKTKRKDLRDDFVFDDVKF